MLFLYIKNINNNCLRHDSKRGGTRCSSICPHPLSPPLMHTNAKQKNGRLHEPPRQARRAIEAGSTSDRGRLDETRSQVRFLIDSYLLPSPKDIEQRAYADDYP